MVWYLEWLLYLDCTNSGGDSTIIYYGFLPELIRFGSFVE